MLLKNMKVTFGDSCLIGHMSPGITSAIVSCCGNIHLPGDKLHICVDGSNTYVTILIIINMLRPL